MTTKLVLKKYNGCYALNDYREPSKGYPLVIAHSDDDGFKYKLSKENCDEIFGVVDVMSLAHKFADKFYNDAIPQRFASYIIGFNKHAELNKDKVFTLEQMNKAIHLACSEYSGNIIDEVTQQPTEIEVEIEMEKVVDETKVIGAVKRIKGSGDKITTYKSIPRFNSNGELILVKA